MSILTFRRDFRRLNELSRVLLYYGLPDLADQLGLMERSRVLGRWLTSGSDEAVRSMTRPQRIRHALEDLGPTFIKLGQVMATRVDLFSTDWIAEFERLQDNATPLPFETMKTQLETALGYPADEVFSEIDPNPVGSASIAQVYKATTRTGEHVAIKIRRPGIESLIEDDLRLLRQLAEVLESRSPEMRRFRPLRIIDEFERSLARELDLSVEARNAERMRDNLKALDWLVIPRMYLEWTRPAVNVQQFIDGIPARQLEAAARAGIDRKIVARRGAQAVWKMMFVDGLFHADPHPGNVLLLPGNRIALLDFGMIGRLGNLRRQQLVDLIRFAALREPARMTQVLADWSEATNLNVVGLTNDISELLDTYMGHGIGDVDISRLLQDLTGILRRHELALPSDIALWAKASLTLDGFGRLLDPALNLTEEALPLLKEYAHQRYSPRRLGSSLGKRAVHLVDWLFRDPDTEEPPHAAANGGWDPRLMEQLTNRLETAHYRLAHSVLVAGLLVAGALMAVTDAGPHLFGISLISVVGIMAIMFASAQATWLLFILWWTRRGREFD